MVFKRFVNWLKTLAQPRVEEKPDCVEQASMDSFPASDPPGWIEMGIKKPVAKPSWPQRVWQKISGKRAA